MWIATLILNSTYVDAQATIENSFQLVYDKVEYEYGYEVKSLDELEISRTGDCSEAAKFVKSKVVRYGINVKYRFGIADCWNGTAFTQTKHNWVEYKGKAYDVPQWGACHNHMVQ